MKITDNSRNAQKHAPLNTTKIYLSPRSFFPGYIYIFFIQQTLDNFKNPDTKENKAERILTTISLSGR